MPSQTETLRFFTALQLHTADWAGKLLLGIGLNETGRTLALASLAAGAASLFLDPDAKQLREANHQGCLTFTVTTLDEALRALKNEIRQGRGITIGLAGEPLSWLHEMVERGVLPYAIAASQSPSEEETTSLQTLHQWGSRALHTTTLPRIHETSHNITEPLESLPLHIMEDAAITLQDRRTRDNQLRNHVLPQLPRSLQERWFDTAPRLFPRGLSRAYWTQKQG
jgi:urocanate hydratase